jgi:hypothetical protein
MKKRWSHPSKLITESDFYDWASTLPGFPRIKIVVDSENARVTLFYHHNHRRRFNRNRIKEALPIGMELITKEVSHKFLKEVK